MTLFRIVQLVGRVMSSPLTANALVDALPVVPTNAISPVASCFGGGGGGGGAAPCAKPRAGRMARKQTEIRQRRRTDEACTDTSWEETSNFEVRTSKSGLREQPISRGADIMTQQT